MHPCRRKGCWACVPGSCGGHLGTAAATYTVARKNGPAVRALSPGLARGKQLCLLPPPVSAGGGGWGRGPWTAQLGRGSAKCPPASCLSLPCSQYCLLARGDAHPVLSGHGQQRPVSPLCRLRRRGPSSPPSRPLHVYSFLFSLVAIGNDRHFHRDRGLPLGVRSGCWPQLSGGSLRPVDCLIPAQRLLSCSRLCRCPDVVCAFL